MRMIVPTSEKWRQANKPVKTVLGLNPGLLVIYLLALFGLKYAFWTSLITSTILTIFFSIIEYRGVPALMALRWVRTQLSGRKKRLWPKWVKH
jgi:hypothetical protein